MRSVHIRPRSRFSHTDRLSSVIKTGHLIGCGKKMEFFGNFWQYYEEVSDDYAEFSTLIKLFPWLFLRYKILVNVLPRI